MVSAYSAYCPLCRQYSVTEPSEPLPRVRGRWNGSALLASPKSRNSLVSASGRRVGTPSEGTSLSPSPDSRPVRYGKRKTSRRGRESNRRFVPGGLGDVQAEEVAEPMEHATAETATTLGGAAPYGLG
jgi:hypothetical protein